MSIPTFDFENFSSKDIVASSMLQSSIVSLAVLMTSGKGVSFRVGNTDLMNGRARDLQEITGTATVSASDQTIMNRNEIKT